MSDAWMGLLARPLKSITSHAWLPTMLLRCSRLLWVVWVW